MNIETLTQADFEQLPLVIEGESKEVRYAGDGQTVIKLKPTIYSYTHNRTGTIPGSDTLRLQAIQKILPTILEAGLSHTYQAVNDQWIVSDLVMQPNIQGQPAPFVPPDLSQEEIKALPKAPPIEVIAKARHTGTSKHRYYDFSNHPTRNGTHIKPEGLYPEPVIRFDWRNPMKHPVNGDRLADEILPEQIADWFIDTQTAKDTASRAFNALQKFFNSNTMDLWDICFFITEDGTQLFGEISPDCMRVRGSDKQALDKDVWRAGGSSSDVLKKWAAMTAMIAKHQQA